MDRCDPDWMDLESLMLKWVSAALAMILAFAFLANGRWPWPVNSSRPEVTSDLDFEYFDKQDSLILDMRRLAESLKTLFDQSEERMKEHRANSVRSAQALTNAMEKLTVLEEKARLDDARATILEMSASRLASQVNSFKSDLARKDALAVEMLKRTKALEISLAAAEASIWKLKETVGHKDQLLLMRKSEAEKKHHDGRNVFGMNLTGRKVVILIEASGRMGASAEDERWKSVTKVAARILEGIRDLDQYSVVIFSDEAKSVTDGFQRFVKGESSAKLVEELSRINPAGGADMHSGFDLAFKLRKLGLESIYLLAAGRPTRGAGFQWNLSKITPQTEISRQLGLHLMETIQTDWNRIGGIFGVPAMVRIDAVGFFSGSDPESGSFLWSLANANRGSFVGIDVP